MPQMNKGGKWVFGWCLVSAGGEIQIPPAAYAEYGFQPGDALIYLCGSRRSGGFSVGRVEKLEGSDNPILRRSIGKGAILSGGRISVPAGANIQPGERLLAVRGSGYAVIFLRRGPIYERALNRADIEVFA